MIPDAPCWVLHDGAAGNSRQAMALAQALGMPCLEWALSPRAPARWFAPWKIPGGARAFNDEFLTRLDAAPPRLAIGCGRQAALATRLARDAGAKAVQILNPRIDPRHWDLVIAPEHDGLHGENVIAMLGSLNPVDAGWLLRARSDFPELGQLPSPRIAVLLGGPTRATAYDFQAIENLTVKLDHWRAVDGGSVMVCGSRRTPEVFRQPIREYYRQVPGITWLDDSDGPNPYSSVLAWAERIVVSPDSVNMISEACATPAPVWIAEPERASGRVQKFIAQLQALGRVRAQQHSPEDFLAAPLNETRRVAEKVRERLGLADPRLHKANIFRTRSRRHRRDFPLP